MTRGTAARLVTACILGLGIAGAAHANRFGGRGGGHFAGAPSFHGGGFRGGGFQHFHGGGFHGRVFIGGAIFAPLYFPAPYYYPPAYYPPAYYPPAYYPPAATQYVEPEPAPAPAPAYWYYCPSSQGYYPYVRECPGGWQRVAPQPPS
jgi:hypothetical protein